MTAGELRKRLEGVDPKINVVLYREYGVGTEFYEITDVSLIKGTPLRNEHTHKAAYRFEDTGPATWSLISFEEA